MAGGLPSIDEGLCGLNFPLASRREHPASLSAGPDGAEEEETSRLSVNMRKGSLTAQYNPPLISDD